MWIKTTNTDEDGSPVTTRMTLPELDQYVEFSSNGKANVPAEVGELLIEEVDTIERAGEDE